MSYSIFSRKCLGLCTQINTDMYSISKYTIEDIYDKLNPLTNPTENLETNCPISLKEVSMTVCLGHLKG